MLVLCCILVCFGQVSPYWLDLVQLGYNCAHSRLPCSYCASSRTQWICFTTLVVLNYSIQLFAGVADCIICVLHCAG